MISTAWTRSTFVRARAVSISPRVLPSFYGAAVGLRWRLEPEARACEGALCARFGPSVQAPLAALLRAASLRRLVSGSGPWGLNPRGLSGCAGGAEELQGPGTVGLRERRRGMARRSMEKTIMRGREFAVTQVRGEAHSSKGGDRGWDVPVRFETAGHRPRYYVGPLEGVLLYRLALKLTRPE